MISWFLSSKEPSLPRAAADTYVRSRSCKVVRLNGRTHESAEGMITSYCRRKNKLSDSGCHRETHAIKGRAKKIRFAI